jgi:hypothetical protein
MHGPSVRVGEACLGNCTELQVICSGMIAKAFQRVGYPILPVVAGVAAGGSALSGAGPHGTLPDRHYSQTLPRDFDVSPNFDIVKFNTPGAYGLDAHLVLDWSAPRPCRPAPASQRGEHLEPRGNRSPSSTRSGRIARRELLSRVVD